MKKATLTAVEKKYPWIKKVKSYQYAVDAVKGNGIFSKWIIKAAERFINDLLREDLYYDQDEIQKVNTFFGEIIYVPELKRSEALHPPRAFFLEQLFAFKYTANDLRRYTSAYHQVGRKSLKTFDAGGISLYEGLTGRDLSPEIMVAANSRDQAIICTNKAGQIIKSSPELRALLDDDHISVHTYKKLINTITYEDRDRLCRIEAMPKDPGDGGNPSVSITDELHEAKSLDHLETAESGQAQRREPLNVVITSPGSNKNGPCYTVLRKKSIDLLEGKIGADRHLALIYEMDSEEELNKIIDSMDDKEPGDRQIHKIAALEKSNPMMRYIPTIAPYLADRMIKAKVEGGAVAANVKIKNGGVWIDAPKIWIPSEKVKANNHGIREDELLGQECYAGWDLARGTDLNAFGLLFPNIRDKYFVWKCWFWLIEERVLNIKKDTVDYRKWVDEGWIIMQKTDTINYTDKDGGVAEIINQAHQDYNVIADGSDPYNLRIGPGPFVHDSIEVTPIGQTFSNLTAPTEQVEQWITNKQMDLMQNPVMEMCFRNVTLHVKDGGSQEGGHSGHRMPSKRESNGRIDGVAALNNAVYEYLRLKSEPKKEVGFTGVDLSDWM